MRDATICPHTHVQTQSNESALCLQRLVALFPKDLFSEYLGPICEKRSRLLYIFRRSLGFANLLY